jgi:hypothetical protein
MTVPFNETFSVKRADSCFPIPQFDDLRENYFQYARWQRWRFSGVLLNAEIKTLSKEIECSVANGSPHRNIRRR